MVVEEEVELVFLVDVEWNIGPVRSLASTVEDVAGSFDSLSSVAGITAVTRK